MKLKLYDRNYIPTADEFNHHMAECIEHKQLLNLQKQLEWFGDDIYGLSIIPIKNKIKHRINEIPEVSKVFDSLTHGQGTSKENKSD